jgi:hypothetical protein
VLDGLFPEQTPSTAKRLPFHHALVTSKDAIYEAEVSKGDLAITEVFGKLTFNIGA